MMRSTTTFLLGALLPILASSTDVPSSTSQVIVPFSTLPLCAQSCGVLFDVQGACGQTELTATSQSCFCNDSRLASFKSGGGTSAVCPASGCDSADSTSIQDWFTTYCASSTSATTTASGTATATKSGTSSTSTGKSSSSTSSSSNATASNTWYVHLRLCVQYHCDRLTCYAQARKSLSIRNHDRCHCRRTRTSMDWWCLASPPPRP